MLSTPAMKMPWNYRARRDDEDIVYQVIISKPKSHLRITKHSAIVVHKRLSIGSDLFNSLWRKELKSLSISLWVGGLNISRKIRQYHVHVSGDG